MHSCGNSDLWWYWYFYLERGLAFWLVYNNYLSLYQAFGWLKYDIHFECRTPTQNYPSVANLTGNCFILYAFYQWGLECVDYIPCRVEGPPKKGSCVYDTKLHLVTLHDSKVHYDKKS